MNAYVCQKKKKKSDYSQVRSTEEELCLNLGEGAVTKIEGGLELRLSGNNRLYLYTFSGHQTSLQFRVPNQSYQATTEGSANPGIVSGLQGEIPRPQHLSSSYSFQKEVMKGNSSRSIPGPIRFKLLPGPGALETETTSKVQGQGERLAVTLPRILSPGQILLFTGPKLQPWFLRPREHRAWKGNRRMPRVKAAGEGALLTTGEKDKAG